MYKVLIVEDEMIERKSLKRMIFDFDLNISEIEVADNGEQGLDLYYQFHPDIILADINMPKLGGLDMIEIIRKEDTNVICLILTSYDYFSYAQKAIRLNVEDFVLKPADKQTVKKSITKAIEKMQEDKNTYIQTSTLVKKMDQIKSLLESECFYAIMTRQEETKLIQTLKVNGIEVHSGLCLIFEDRKNSYEVTTDFRNEIEEIGYACIQGNINEQLILFVVSNRLMEQDDMQVLNHFIDVHQLRSFNFAVGELKEDAISLYASYEEAVYNLRNAHQDKNKINFVDKKEDELISFAINWANVLIDNLENTNQELISNFCKEIMQYDNEKINQIISLIIHKMTKCIEKKYGLMINVKEINYCIPEQGSYYNLEIVVNQILQKMLKPIKSIKYQNSSHLMKKAIKFIDKNYMKPISLNDLAEELNVSSFYISKLFNKEGALNFTQMVNDLRVKEAKRLIKDNYSFKEVASIVGFGSQSYFTKIFKKKVGMSPKEYRNMF